MKCVDVTALESAVPRGAVKSRSVFFASPKLVSPVEVREFIAHAVA